MIGGTRFRIDASIALQSALAARIARGQSDIATGTRLRVASDDPAASAQVSQISRALSDSSAWRDVAVQGAALAAQAGATLSAAQSALDRARELTTIAASAANSQSDRATIAGELRAIADDIDALALASDASGERVFADGPAIALPVGANERIVPTLSRADAFGAGALDLGITLRAAADAMSGDDAARAMALASVVQAGGRVADAQAAIGIRAARLDAVVTRLTDRDAVLTEQQGALEGTDVAATVARIQADQLSLDASRSLFARVNRQTLFDLLG